LTIVKDPTCFVDDITKLLRNSIPEVEIDQNVGAELSYILPDSKSQLFPEVFEKLESKKKELGIASYGVSVRVGMDSIISRSIFLGQLNHYGGSFYEV
jgi:ATP-binding cassette subfamily A (ABC1) protein 3